MKSFNFINGMLSFLLPLGLIFCLQNRHTLNPSVVAKSENLMSKNQTRNYVLHLNQTKKIPIRVLIKPSPSVVCASMQLTKSKPQLPENDFVVFCPYDVNESTDENKFIKINQTEHKKSKFFNQLISQISERYHIDNEDITLSEISEQGD